MREKEPSSEAHSPDNHHEVKPAEESKAKKRRFVEPEISVPADIFETTKLFFQDSAQVDIGGFGDGG